MRRSLIAGMVAAVAGTAVSIDAHKTVVSPFTYTKDVLPIVQARCASCHRDGGAGASLNTYEAASRFPFGLQQVLLAGSPAPSLADGIAARPEHRALSMIEFDTLMTWSAGGTPEPGAPRPHQTHASGFGGVFLPLAGDTMHIEVVWQEQRRVRLHVTDAVGTPLDADRLLALRARLITVTDGAAARFVLAAARDHLEARIATLSAPNSMRVFVTLPDAGEQQIEVTLAALSAPFPDFIVAPIGLPKDVPQMLALVAAQTRVAEQLGSEGLFGQLYVPTTHLRDVLLALRSTAGPTHNAALAEAMRAVWLVHLSGDVGSPQQARAALVELRRTTDALQQSWKP